MQYLFRASAIHITLFLRSLVWYHNFFKSTVTVEEVLTTKMYYPLCSIIVIIALFFVTWCFCCHIHCYIHLSPGFGVSFGLSVQGEVQLQGESSVPSVQGGTISTAVEQLRDSVALHLPSFRQ